MRAIITYDHRARLMTFFIHGAPHRRSTSRWRSVLQAYRKMLWDAAQVAGIKTQIKHTVGLSALFVDPTGPDLDNLITALFQALDGKTGKGPTILDDDRRIAWIEKVGIHINN